MIATSITYIVENKELILSYAEKRHLYNLASYLYNDYSVYPILPNLLLIYEINKK